MGTIPHSTMEGSLQSFQPSVNEEHNLPVLPSRFTADLDAAIQDPKRRQKMLEGNQQRGSSWLMKLLRQPSRNDSALLVHSPQKGTVPLPPMYSDGACAVPGRLTGSGSSEVWHSELDDQEVMSAPVHGSANAVLDVLHGELEAPLDATQCHRQRELTFMGMLSGNAGDSGPTLHEIQLHESVGNTESSAQVSYLEFGSRQARYPTGIVVASGAAGTEGLPGLPLPGATPLMAVNALQVASSSSTAELVDAQPCRAEEVVGPYALHDSMEATAAGLIHSTEDPHSPPTSPSYYRTYDSHLSAAPSFSQLPISVSNSNLHLPLSHLGPRSAISASSSFSFLPSTLQADIVIGAATHQVTSASLAQVSQQHQRPPSMQSNSSWVARQGQHAPLAGLPPVPPPVPAHSGRSVPTRPVLPALPEIMEAGSSQASQHSSQHSPAYAGAFSHTPGAATRMRSLNTQPSHASQLLASLSDIEGASYSAGGRSAGSHTPPPATLVVDASAGHCRVCGAQAGVTACSAVSLSHTRRSPGGGGDGGELEAEVEGALLRQRRVLERSGCVLDEVEVDRVLGFGSMGVVYSARLWDTRVVIKLIEHGKGVLGREQHRGRMARVEATLSRALLHPNVVTTYDCYTGPVTASRLAKLVGRPGGPGGGGGRNARQRVMTVMVQELCEYGTLRDALNKGTHALDKKSPAYWTHATRIALDIANGMHYLAQLRIIHADLKAENVLLQKVPESSAHPHGVVAKVADLGLAQLLPPGCTELQGGVHGTVSHMPPEALASATFSLATDVFSFGVLLWELAAGPLAPYKGLAAADVVQAVCAGGARPVWPDDAPAVFRQLGERCWQSDASVRPTFADIVDTLRASLGLGRLSDVLRMLSRASNASNASHESDELEAALRLQQRHAHDTPRHSDVQGDADTAKAGRALPPAPPKDRLGAMLWHLCQPPPDSLAAAELLTHTYTDAEGGTGLQSVAWAVRLLAAD